MGRGVIENSVQRCLVWKEGLLGSFDTLYIDVVVAKEYFEVFCMDVIIAQECFEAFEIHTHFLERTL